jgi:hypothetical protein
MITVIRSPLGLSLIEDLPNSQPRWFRALFVNHSLRSWREHAGWSEKPRRETNGCASGPYENPSIRRNPVSLAAFGFRASSHSPFSSDLAPSDLYMFEDVESRFQGSSFATNENLLEVIQDAIDITSRKEWDAFFGIRNRFWENAVSWKAAIFPEQILKAILRIMDWR